MSEENNQSSQGLAYQIVSLSKRAVGITSSPSTTLDITIDITEESKTERALGQMVHFILKEDAKDILAIGQIIEVTTKNRWHEDQSFKGVIKRHGALPHLSDVADNRIANISVQSCFDLMGKVPIAHILGISPSTGGQVKKMNNKVMDKLIDHQRNEVTYIGRVYGTEVDMPMWFKHFGKDDDANSEYGVGDSYHSGIFGKTGSGKTVTASFMLLGYARNRNNMNILVLDPQQQFFMDKELLPNDAKLEEQVGKIGMEYKKYRLLKDVFLPNDVWLLGDLLNSSGFIRKASQITTGDKQDAMRDSIVDYMVGRTNDPKFKLEEVDSLDLLKSMLDKFIGGEEESPTKYITNIYSQKNRQDKLRRDLQQFRVSMEQPSSRDILQKWKEVFVLFSEKKQDGESKIPIEELIGKIVSDSKKGNFVVLDLSTAHQPGKIENENLQALFLRIVENKIAERGISLYEQGKKANCLIAMDEAHRFISRNSPDPRVRELTREIIDSVRTVRKCGIGHMFITQTLESLDDEIIKQMRAFAFGHGLVTGGELRKVGEIINSSAAVNLYKSFIDPASIKRYPFMFFGPMSPFSATGSPLFVEIYTNFSDFKEKNFKKAEYGQA